MEPQLTDNVVAPQGAASPSSLGKQPPIWGQENYSLGHYPQNIIGGNLDQIGYCTKVDGSLLQREIFPAPATHTKLSPYESPGVVALKLVYWSGLDGSKLQVDRHSSEYVQMHNRRCQRSLQVRIRRLSVSSSTSMAAERVCLNFLWCPRF